MKTPAAILTSSSIRSPSKEMGRVLSQTLDSLVVLERSLAGACGPEEVYCKPAGTRFPGGGGKESGGACGSEEVSSKTLREACTCGLSGVGRGGWSYIAFAPFPAGILNSGVGGTLHTVREDPIDRPSQPAEEAGKAEGASWTALQTPIPPDRYMGDFIPFQYHDIEWKYKMTFGPEVHFM